MNPHPDMDALLSGYEARWTAGEIAALGEAVAFCGWNSYPLPEWCVGPVIEALNLYNHQGGRGRAQSLAGKFAAQQTKERRHEMVALELQFGRARGKPLTVLQACEIVAKQLKGENVSARAVEKSYREIETARK